MAKKPTRTPRRRDRSYRAGPAPQADPSPYIEQQDWTQANQTANAADAALMNAEGSFQAVTQAAEEAEIAADLAVRAAVQAEEAAAWVLADAERMVAAAAARVEAARALARAGRQVAADALEGELEAEAADPDVPSGPNLNPSFQAARRAMDAACGSPSRRRYN
ncbi:MAG TPA: hypothetical protein VGW40_07395 [Allosphingosinicella sp.]|nr:hypothetical protein [Allosphingosinicella sp.]